MSAVTLLWFFISLLILMAYLAMVSAFILGWHKTKEFKVNAPASSFTTKVTVLVPVRNEEKNILNCLNSLIAQTYSNALFEIIVVDDCSSDKTKEIVQEFCSLTTNVSIRLIELIEDENRSAQKKRAIEYGIAASTGDLIITTDADCIAPKNWILSIVSFYINTKAKMISAPVLMQGGRHASVWNSFQTLDFFSLVLSGAASLHYNKPLLCNGANLAFEKSAYFDVLPTVTGKLLASGDDLFLMLAIKNKYPHSVKFLKSTDALVLTSPQPSFNSLINQRKRWASKGSSYSDSYLSSVSVLIAAFHFILLITASISFFDLQFLQLFLGLFLSKSIVDFVFLFQAAGFFGKREMLNYFLQTELINLFFIPGIIISSLKRGYNWKSRTITK